MKGAEALRRFVRFVNMAKLEFSKICWHKKILYDHNGFLDKKLVIPYEFNLHLLYIKLAKLALLPTFVFKLYICNFLLYLHHVMLDCISRLHTSLFLFILNETATKLVTLAFLCCVEFVKNPILLLAKLALLPTLYSRDTFQAASATNHYRPRM